MSPRLVPASPGQTGPLSPHFHSVELRCAHCGACVVRHELVRLLERIRATVGHPLHVVSAYRCPVHNHDVGGAQDSQHMYGTAADLAPTTLTRADAARLGAKGIGTKAGVVVHVDVREGPAAHWTYDRE